MRLILSTLYTLAGAAMAVAIAMWMPGPVGFGLSGLGVALTVAWVVGLAVLAWRDGR